MRCFDIYFNDSIIILVQLVDGDLILKKNGIVYYDKLSDLVVRVKDSACCQVAVTLDIGKNINKNITKEK